MTAKPYSVRPDWALQLEAWDFAEVEHAEPVLYRLADADLVCHAASLTRGVVG